jgi:uncharacterized SAM-binding protein YcdF (DUF218 family)
VGRLELFKRRAIAAAALLAVWSLLAWGAGRALVVSAPLERADAVVVLSGSSTYVERTRRAARLLREGRAPKVILTNDATRGGYSAEEDRNPLFVERAAAELRRAGVADGQIELVPEPVTSTYEEAARLRLYAESRGLRSLIVVTSGYHSRRALWTLGRAFEGSGVSVGLEPVEPGEQTPRPALWWLSPLGWKLVPGEYLKLAYYRLRY